MVHAAVGALLSTVLVTVASGHVSDLVVASSAGCDDQDPTPCPAEPDQLLWVYSLNYTGELRALRKANLTSKAPVWLTVRPKSDSLPGCLFVTLADSSEILSQSLSHLYLDLKKVDSHGVNPVHATVSSDGGTLVVANYHGPDDVCNSTGSGVASFIIGDDCGLTFADAIPHAGSSVMKSRQCASHMHSFTAGRDMFAFACDLGSDLIFTYRIASDGKLTESARTPTTPGSGPRHAVQHPTKPILYVIFEMGSVVVAYNIERSGHLTQIMNVTTLPSPELTQGYGSKAAEIVIAADGSTLYASNRAFDPKFSNTIAVYAVRSDGSLEIKQQVDAPSYPRGMVLSRDGSLLVVASQHTGILQSFKVEKSGLLKYSGFDVEGPPTCAALSIVPKPQAAAPVLHI